MIELDNDLLGIDCPSPVSQWDMVERADAATSFWGAIAAELDNCLIRDFGLPRWCEYSGAVLRSHQRRFFLPGLDKLGISTALPDAARCALYHAISNALGGVRTRYSIESPHKAWILYYPPTAGTGQALYPDEYMLSGFGGWHVNNGEALENRGLVFVVTHLQSRGDPFDAGYFLDTGEPVPAADRLRVAFGEQPPLPAERRLPEVDENVWPHERRVKAMRNFSVEYAWDRIATSVAHFGPEAFDSVRHGCETVLFSFLPLYASAIPATGVALAAGYFAAVHEICGWTVTTARNGSDTTVVLDRDPIRLAVDTLSTHQIADTYHALARAWAAPAAEFGVEVVLDTCAAQPSWRFTPSAAH